MRYWDIFTGSFHSAATYRAMRYTARGTGLGYSFVLVAFTTVLLVIYAIAMVNSAVFVSHDGNKPVFDDVVDQIAAQLPQMTFKDGVLRAEGPQPRIIVLSVDMFGQNLSGGAITIDTTGATTHQNMRTPMLITDKEIVTKTKDKIEIHPLSQYTQPGKPPLILNRALEADLAARTKVFVHRNLWQFYLFLSITLWAVLAGVMYVTRLFMLLALAVATLVVSAIRDRPLEFEQAMRLSAVAYTPLALLDIAALAIGGASLPRLLLFLLALGLVAVALWVTDADGA